MYDNLQSGLVDSMIVKVRGWSGGKVLLLSAPSMTLLKDEGKIDGTLIAGPGGSYIIKQTFITMAAEGCNMCKAPISIVDAQEGYVGWHTATKKPICPDCVTAIGESKHG